MIDGKTVEYGKNAEIRIVRKDFNESGDEKIDVRIWQRFKGQEDFCPTKKGLYLAPELWDLIVREVDKLIKEDGVSSGSSDV